jgi:hypothetical protein
MAETIKTTLTADGSQFEAAFKRAEAVVTTYHATLASKQKSALAMEADTIRALSLEAAGQKAAAAALRERIAIQEQAARLMARTGAGEIDALSLASQRIQAEKQLAATQAKTTGPRQLPELVLTPEYLRRLDQATAKKHELANAAYRAGRGGMAGSMGFLAFSQAVEDAQYGIRGVLNNIPQMVLGFGGTMGLAGAISLAAVAATALYPHLKKLTGAAMTEQLKKGAEAFAESWKKSAEAARSLRFESTLSATIAADAERRHQALRESLTVQNAMIKVMERELTLRQSARALQDELAAARTGLATASGADPRAATSATREQEMKRLREDAATNRKIADNAAYEARRLREAKEASASVYAAEIAGKDRALDEQRRQLAHNEARLAEAKAKTEAGDKGTQTHLELRRLEKANLAYTQTIATLEATRNSLAEVSRTAQDAAKQELDTLNATVQARSDEAAAIAATIEQRAKLFEVQDATRAAESWNAWQKAVRAATEEGKRQADQAAENAMRLNEAAAAAMEREGRMRSARAAAAGEIAAMELQLRGKKDYATALTHELDLRRQAAAIAEEQGITEAKALQKLRLRERLQARLDAGPGGPRPGRHQLGFGPSRLEGREGFLNGSASLRNSEIERRNRHRKTPLPTNDPAAKYWERQLDLQQKLVTHLAKLGLA